MPAAIPIAGAVAGSVVSGALNKSSSGGSQTVDKSPWEPAQPLLKNLINQGQDLSSYYQSNPFNPLQQQAYQNQFSALDNFNNNIGPGVLKGLQGLLGSNFGDISSFGLLGQGSGGQSPQRSNFGQIDWKQMSPYTSGLLSASPMSNTPAQLTPAEQDAERKRQEQEAALQAYMDMERLGAGAGGAD